MRRITAPIALFVVFTLFVGTMSSFAQERVPGRLEAAATTIDRQFRPTIAATVDVPTPAQFVDQPPVVRPSPKAALIVVGILATAGLILKFFVLFT